VGYVRVSTTRQGDSGLGLESQEQTIRAECARRGWTLDHIYSDVASGKTDRRLGLHAALAALNSGHATGLVVAKLDRLTRSTQDFAMMLVKARKQDWDLVVADLGVDTSTPNGELVASIIATIAQWERRMIQDRTREGLAVARERGTRLGRPPVVSDDVVKRVKAEREKGATLRAIADGLTCDGVPTGHGGRQWYPSTVKSLLTR
jgi:DNA invertase Pin-like site-specific DNA recombinase